MVWLVSGATRTVAQHPTLGVLIEPRGRRVQPVPSGRLWAMDNGAFSGFDAGAFVRMLDQWQGRQGCLFVAAPDVVGDAAATLTLFRQWAPCIRAWGYPVAYVVQDGTPRVRVPWSECDAVFIGGSTAFKESQAAATVAGYARAKGHWVHMGRVNTRSRLRWAEDIGCQSVDGTGFSRFSEDYVKRVRRWTRQRRLSFA